MNMRMNARLSVALLLMMAVLMSFRVGFAQDEGGDTSTETPGNDNTAQTTDNTDVSAEPTAAPTAEPAGVGEIAKAADDFNVPALLTPQDEDRAVSALARRLFKSPADFMNPQIQMRFQNEKMNLSMLRTVNQNIERVKRVMEGGSSQPKRMPLGQTPSGDILAQVTDDSSGDIMTVFTDYSVVMADAKEETFFEGYIAGESAETLMILGQDTDGNQYALSNGDVIGLTASNDVFLGGGDHLYFYDFGEDGNFVGLTDSDGNNYEVETAADGSTTITDAAGDIGDFNADGSYDIKDPAGDVLDQGALFGENDGDPMVTPEATVDAGSPNADSGDQPNATLAPENGGDASSSGDSGDGG
jgi:hypothetical protein